MTTTTPRIYVACLAAYNGGHLHGAWIDCDQDADAIHEEIQEMLKASPVPDAEEWAIHDAEGWGDIKAEKESIETLADLAEAIEDKGEVFAMFWSNQHGSWDDVADAVKDFEENYQGEHSSLADYAENFMEETGGLPKDLDPLIARNIDWEAIGREFETGGDIYTFEVGGRVHVFTNQ